MKQAKITALTSIGTSLEYYDYALYIIFASYISQNFFPSTNPTAALFATFGVFATGNIMRSLGGIVFGIFGDRLGRKKVFSTTLFWMALATFIMGITPPFATIGLIATVIFSLCRILQGITCGAEIPGATTFLLEHTNEKRRGLHFGFMTSALGLGSSFALLVAWALTKTLSSEQMATWGFRLPFLFGGILALFGFMIRKHLPETPAFLAIKKTEDKPLTTINLHSFKQICNTTGILIFPACLITFFLTAPVYLNNFYHYSFPDIYLAITIGSLWTAFLIPIFGWASDTFINRKSLLLITVLIFVLFSFPLFSLLNLKSRLALFAFILLGKTFIAAMAASYFVLLPQTFPIRFRYTGTAFSYNAAYTLAALFPLGMNYIYGVLKQPNYMIALFLSLATVTIISILKLKVKHHMGIILDLQQTTV